MEIIENTIDSIFANKAAWVDSKNNSASTVPYIKSRTNPKLKATTNPPTTDTNVSIHHSLMTLELGTFCHSMPLANFISGLLALHIC